MKAINFSEEEMNHVRAVLLRMQRVSSVQTEKPLFWGDEDWYVVLQALTDTGMIRRLHRQPYREFTDMLITKGIDLRDTVNAKMLSRLAPLMREGYPWKSLEGGAYANCAPRWRKLYLWLLHEL